MIYCNIEYLLNFFLVKIKWWIWTIKPTIKRRRVKYIGIKKLDCWIAGIGKEQRRGNQAIRKKIWIFKIKKKK